jgi:hypothetical protein
LISIELQTGIDEIQIAFDRFMQIARLQTKPRPYRNWAA